MPTDAEEYGAIVNSLVGGTCERTLATNSLKLRFETYLGPRGRSYIWVDPPWELVSPHGLVTSSAEYDYKDFPLWSNLLAALDRAVFESWRVNADRSVVFNFANGYRIVVPWESKQHENDNWYSHWYASDATV